MRFNWNMPDALRLFYKEELTAYRNCIRKEDFVTAWNHLERAHILGQPYPVEHTSVHFKMLLFGIKMRNAKEVFGQIPRLLVGGIKSWAGIIPVGNTGGANVSPWKVMPIPNDLELIIRQNLD